MVSRKPNETTRLIITTFLGVAFGFFIGVSFPTLSLSKVTRFISHFKFLCSSSLLFVHFIFSCSYMVMLINFCYFSNFLNLHDRHYNCF